MADFVAKVPKYQATIFSKETQLNHACAYRRRVRSIRSCPPGLSAVGTERRPFGLNFMPGIGGAVDLPRLDRTSKIGANDPQETWAAQNCCCTKSIIAGCPSSTSNRRPRDGSVVSSPPLHGHAPRGGVTWQSTLVGKSSFPRLASMANAWPLAARAWQYRTAPPANHARWRESAAFSEGVP
jgi:hypothetical protein